MPHNHYIKSLNFLSSVLQDKLLALAQFLVSSRMLQQVVLRVPFLGHSRILLLVQQVEHFLHRQTHQHLVKQSLSVSALQQACSDKHSSRPNNKLRCSANLQHRPQVSLEPQPQQQVRISVAYKKSLQELKFSSAFFFFFLCLNCHETCKRSLFLIQYFKEKRRIKKNVPNFK